MNPVLSPIKVSAPGSIMIAGEHAVVYGHRAIVTAIDQRVEVTLAPRQDTKVRITSEIAAPLEVELDDLPTDGPYRFVCAAVALHAADLPNGCDLDIQSEIDPTLGLGSSAAVTVACLGALSRFAGKEVTDLHGDALAIVRRLQGRGSGADLAASLCGGMVAYQIPGAPDAAARIDPLPRPPDVTSLCYAGYKTPTAEVLTLVAARMEQDPSRFAALYEQMGHVSEVAITAAGAGDWCSFYRSLNDFQALMVDLGVSDDVLDQIVEQAIKDPETQAVKISGSGLGDCVVAFGGPPSGFVKVRIADKGLWFDD